MDSFEQLVGSLLEKEGYWVKTSYKVELTKAEKIRIERPSSPRWELDLIAYKANTNELLMVECKSFLDSRGAKYIEIADKNHKLNRYKLFSDPVLRKIVMNRLARQLMNTGACVAPIKPRLCLAAGKVISDADRDKIKKLFGRKGWKLFDEEWLKDRLLSASKAGYENEVASVVAKILLR